MKHSYFCRENSEVLKNMKRFFSLLLAALLVVLGFSSCSKSLYGKGNKAEEEIHPESVPGSSIAEYPKIDPTMPSGGNAVRVMYGPPPRNFRRLH